MSSRCRGKRRQRSQGKKTRDLGDITLNDFANSAVSSGNGRLKKPIRNILRGVDHLPETAQNKLYEEVFDSLEENTGNQKRRGAKPSRRKTKMDYAGAVPEEDEGIRYPIDLWFLISEYIDPETVATFASICRDSMHVVETAGFWNSLYKRYFEANPALPESLQPDAMGQRCGLRARVIRALHYMHRPLMLRSGHNPVPHSKVCNRQVTSQWYQVNLGCGHWVYYFKLKDVNFWNDPEPEVRKLTEILDDISVNREDGSVVLKIICTQYVQLPLLVGMVLRDISFSAPISGVSEMQLKFNCSFATTTPNITVNFSPVLGYYVLNWWNSGYPHTERLLPSIGNDPDDCFEEE